MEGWVGLRIAPFKAMATDRPTLAQALDEDRKAYERAQAQPPMTGFADLSGRLQLALRLDQAILLREEQRD